MRAGFVGLSLGFAALVACYSPTPAPGLPCAEDRQCPDGQVCSPAEVCISSGSVRALHDDDTNDFEDADVTLDNAIITRQGYVESAPWMAHGLRVTAINGAAFSDPATASWEELLTQPLAGQGYLYSSQIRWSETGFPFGLGLGKGTEVTVLIEGEIYLDAGSWRLALEADDLGFLDLAEPGAKAFRRLMTARYDGAGSANLEVARAGWYPVRLATVNRTLAGNIVLLGALGNGTSNALDASRVRAAVPASATGLVQDAFDSPFQLHFRSTMIAGDIRELSYLGEAPPDSGITSAGTYSLRWSGQFFLEEALEGFTLTTEGGGHRIWIDGQLRADKLLTNGGVSVLTDLKLAPGWHDLVIDLDKRLTANTSMRITAFDGDEDAFAPERLRPVLGPSLRWMGARQAFTPIALPLPGAVPNSVTRNLFLPNIPGNVLSGNAEFTVSHTDFSELTLSARWGTTVSTLAALGAMTGMGRQRRSFSLDPKDFTPTPIPGTSWSLTAADAVANVGTGTVEEVSVVVRYAATSAASAPFSQVATYTSAPRELDEPVAFGKVSWKLRSAEGVTAVVALRTCAVEEECATAEWLPVDAEGLPAATPNRYVQYRVTLTASGLVAAALDSFTLEYYSGED